MLGRGRPQYSDVPQHGEEHGGSDVRLDSMDPFTGGYDNGQTRGPPSGYEPAPIHDDADALLRQQQDNGQRDGGQNPAGSQDSGFGAAHRDFMRHYGKGT
jgi:hypothetical protein